MYVGVYQKLRYLNVLLDVIWLNVAILLSFYFYGVMNRHAYYQQHKVLLFFILINAVWLLSANIFKIYNHYEEKSSVIIYNFMIKAFMVFLSIMCVVISVLLLINDSTLEGMNLGVVFYFTLFLVFFLALIGNRLLLLGIRKKKRENGSIKRNKIVIVGGRCFSKEMGRRLLEDYNPFEIVGIFYDRKQGADDGLNGLYKGSFEQAFSYINQNKVDEVFCLGKGLDQNSVGRLLDVSDNHVIRFRMLLDVYDYLPSSGQVEIINQIPVYRARVEPLQVLGNSFLKQAFDVIFSGLVILLLLSWLLPILAILIRLESKGPVFFKQKRSGKGNKDFYCLKLRSMYVNNEANKKQAVKNDKRITKIGAFLRKTSLDELPQFFNVFAGSMSIVGPRPHMLAHTEEYAALVGKYMVRHFSSPGITGWAQINGSRGETRTIGEMEKRVKLDVWYIENWSFILDMKIIFLTFWKVIKGDEKAY